VAASDPTRRGLLTGLGAVSLAGALAARPARAQTGVIVGTWPGDYAEQLILDVDTPLLKPLGIDVLQELAPEDARQADRGAADAPRHARRRDDV
jgi:putative spermidine/putrescine transport system substrate-binding protein